MVEDVFEACDVDVGIDPRASLGFGHRQPMGLDRAGVATCRTPPPLLLVKSPAVMQIWITRGCSRDGNTAAVLVAEEVERVEVDELARLDLAAVVDDEAVDTTIQHAFFPQTAPIDVGLPRQIPSVRYLGFRMREEDGALVVSATDKQGFTQVRPLIVR